VEAQAEGDGDVGAVERTVGATLILGGELGDQVRRGAIEELAADAQVVPAIVDDLAAAAHAEAKLAAPLRDRLDGASHDHRLLDRWGIIDLGRGCNDGRLDHHGGGRHIDAGRRRRNHNGRRRRRDHDHLGQVAAQVPTDALADVHVRRNRAEGRRGRDIDGRRRDINGRRGRLDVDRRRGRNVSWRWRHLDIDARTERLRLRQGRKRYDPEYEEEA
jgi:hypothetical protein